MDIIGQKAIFIFTFFQFRFCLFAVGDVLK